MNEPLTECGTASITSETAHIVLFIIEFERQIDTESTDLYHDTTNQVGQPIQNL